MGVPGFFLWLLKNYKNNNFVFNKEQLQMPHDKEILDEINILDWFLIDANCLIHPVCYKTIAENPDLTNEDKLENKMINNILEYFEKIINYVDPQRGIYIAIDGVAPSAKIKQQRSRRYKSVADKIMWNNIKKKHNKPITPQWNNNAITPGTKFMIKLHDCIIKWAKNLNRHIIYSSCLTPAEGEHKLLQFIRKNQRTGLDLSYIIYGLDADLIFLALSTESNRIFLLREANEINKNESKEVLNYVSINIMRNSIVNTVKKYLEKTIKMNEISDDKKIYGFNNLNDICVVNDFIFMCYFLGNDFLPHIPSLNIHNNGIETLIITYVETMNELILEKNKIIYLLVEKKKVVNKINMEFLTIFIDKLAQKEDQILRDHFYQGKKRVFYNGSGDLYEREVFNIENLQFKIADPIQLGSDNSIKWRERYYKYYWNIDADELEDFSKKLVENYLIGIKWVTMYYFDDCPSWSWYYPFDYPPFLTDIKNYLLDLNKIKFKKGKPLKPFMQLLSVFPQQSSYLIPKNLRKIMTNSKSSLAYMYPLEFKQDFINKTKYWMGIPKLPPLDIDLIIYIFNKYENELSQEEKKRNNSIQPIIIN